MIVKLVLLFTAFLLTLSACSDKPSTSDTEPSVSESTSESTATETTEPPSTETETKEMTDVPATASTDAKPTILVKATRLADSETTSVDKSNPAWKQNLKKPALMSFEDGKNYYWDLDTNKGTMSFRLFHKSAPMHATSTIYLTKLGFYDDVVFHRVIQGFMAQGGDPTGTGMGGPGYSYAGEFDGTTSHSRPGMLSMANSGPNTDGSQFFITFGPTPHLDGRHTIFGELIVGQETLSELEKQGSRSGKTSELLQITRATVRTE